MFNSKLFQFNKINRGVVSASPAPPSGYTPDKYIQVI